MSHRRTHHTGSDYRIRLLTCMAAALLVAVGAVRFWPADGDENSERRIYRTSEREVIRIDETLPTRQPNAQPAPPAPPIPVLVPEEYVLEEPELDFGQGLLPIEAPGEDPLSAEGEADESSAQPVGPTVGPKTVRFVEPEYTREARRRRIRAELVVRVLVDARGRVESAEIIERFLLDRNGTSRTPVEMLGFGLEEAALSAADRWMFRPARKNGEPVASHTELTFTFGIDA